MRAKTTALVIAAVAMTLGATAFAQDAGPRGGKPGAGAAGVAKQMQAVHKKVLGELNLTAAQMEQVAALDKKRQEDIEKLRRENKGADRSTLRPKMQAIQQEYRAGLQKTLTPQQWETYQTRMKEEMQKLRGNRPKGERPGKPSKPLSV